MSQSEISLLRRFQAECVLNEDSHCKKLVVLGRIDDENAILELEKTAFHGAVPSELLSVLEVAAESLSLLHHNDIWYSFHEPHAGLKLDLTFPASPMDISKKKAQKMTLVSETPDMYRRIVLPWIESHPIERNHWIRNILEGQAEVESIVFQNEDIVILPDSKWDRVSTDHLYLLVIFKDERLRSLRDFALMHLPLLQSVRAHLSRILQERYQLAATDCRIYFHYLPTFYWAHLHVHRASSSESSGGFAVGKAFLLEDVMEHVKDFDATYYQRKIMHYYLGQSHPLYAALTMEQ